MSAHGRSRACVFGPSLYVTVTIEPAPGRGGHDAIHFHPGGQGFWIARVMATLGEPVELLSPLGGESGRVLRAITSTCGMHLRGVTIGGPSPSYVHDRRRGRRTEVATTALPSLNRHELDDYYGLVLERSLRAGLCVVTGRAPGDPLPLDVYNRLGSDLASMGVTVVGDLHGPELSALLDGGPIHTLKVSDEDLVADGLLAEDPAPAQRRETVVAMADRGVERVVLSAASGPTYGWFDGHLYRADVPHLDTVDPRGSGDSMTAGLAVAAIRNLEPERALRYGCAAGAANATRHGLGNVKPGVVDAIADHIEVAPADG